MNKVLRNVTAGLSAFALAGSMCLGGLPAVMQANGSAQQAGIQQAWADEERTPVASGEDTENNFKWAIYSTEAESSFYEIVVDPLDASKDAIIPDFTAGSVNMPPWFSGTVRDTKVEAVTIGEGITSIGSYAFASMDSRGYGLSHVSIPSSVEKIGEGAFSGLGVYIGDLDFSSMPPKCPVTLKEVQITVGNGTAGGTASKLKSIGAKAFAYYADQVESLRSNTMYNVVGDSVTFSTIYLPKGTEVADDAFYMADDTSAANASFIKYVPTAEDIAAKDAAIEKIAAIGTVTVDSKDAIAAARAAYDALDDDMKALVPAEDLATLEAAEAAYVTAVEDALATAKANLAEAQGKLEAAQAAADEDAKTIESLKADVAAAKTELEAAKADLEAAQAAVAAGLKASTFTVSAKAVKAKATKKTTVKAKKAFTVKNAAGKLTYARLSGNAKVTVNAKGKVTVKKGLKKGKTVKVKVLVVDAGSATVAPAAKTVTLKIKVK